jgi:AbiV family abortive infection protein
MTQWNFDINSIGIDVIAMVNPGSVVKASIKNAVDLIDEAELLYDHRRYARANLLALLAVEEVAKATLIDDHHRQPNMQLKKDLLSHKVKFGSKEKVTVWRKQRVAFVLAANKDAGKDNEARQDAMYVGVRGMKVIRPSRIRSSTAKKNITRAKQDVYYFYFWYHLNVWRKYELKLPKPPHYIKTNKS